MFIEEFLQTVANEYSLSFSEVKELFHSEFERDHDFNFTNFGRIFENFKKFVKELGIVTCGSVIYYLRYLEL